MCTGHFGAFLARSRVEGTTKVYCLLSDICHRSYPRSYRHLARFLAPWATTVHCRTGDGFSADQEAPVRLLVHVPDLAPASSPIDRRQVVNVDALKIASAELTLTCGLAMRSRGLLRGGTVEKLDGWISDARRSGIYDMQRFARALRHEIEAARNAVLEPWSNGKTEGRIKTDSRR